MLIHSVLTQRPPSGVLISIRIIDTGHGYSSAGDKMEYGYKATAQRYAWNFWKSGRPFDSGFRWTISISVVQKCLQLHKNKYQTTNYNSPPTNAPPFLSDVIINTEQKPVMESLHRISWTQNGLMDCWWCPFCQNIRYLRFLSYKISCKY